MEPKAIISALNWRYAVQTFDTAKPLAPELLHTVLDSGRLAPSPYGVEPWKFIVVENPELRAKLREVSYGQSKVTDAAALVVVAHRTDVENLGKERVERGARITGAATETFGGFRQMIDGATSRVSAAGTAREWTRHQAGIALGMMVQSAALLGVDAGPMEGFDADAVDALLGLKEKNLHASSMLALGYRGDDAAALRPKVRRDFEEVVEFIR